MPPRNRQYQTRGKGTIDLGSILLGALGGAGTGEIEPIPNIPLEGPTQAGGILETPPQQYRVKEKTRDYTGRGQEQANQANIRAQEAREAEKSTLRTREAEIPLRIKEETLLSPVLQDRAKAIAILQGDQQLRVNAGITDKALKDLVEKHKIDTQGELERIRATGPEQTKQDVAKEEQLGGVRTKNEVARLKATNPEEIAKARELARINLASSEGIDPTEERVNTFGNTLTEPRIAAKKIGAEKLGAENMLGYETARKGLDISDITRANDLDTAGKESQFRNIAAGQELQAQPLLQQQRMQIIPRMAEQNYYDELRKRLFPASQGESIVDIAHPGKPFYSGPSKIEQAETDIQRIKAKRLSNPMGEIPPTSTGPVNPDMQFVPGVGWVRKKKP